jgi:predicted DNA-binding transcriptional regulator YafY
MQASELLNLLQAHKGRAKGIKCAALAAQAGITERQARKLISDLRFDGCAVVGTPESGYYLADSADEVTEFTEFHWHRIRHSMAIVSRVTKQSIPALMGQLSLLETQTS